MGEFYSNLSKASKALAGLVNMFQFLDSKPLPEKKCEVAAFCGDASNYYYQNKIYFDRELCASADGVIKTMHEAFIAFDVAQEGDTCRSDATGLWKEAHTKVQLSLPPLLAELEEKFRVILGASPHGA